MRERDNPIHCLFHCLHRPTANWMLWNAWGGLYQLDPTSHPTVCHAYSLEDCMVFPWLGAHNAFPAALAEKQGAVDTYLRLNESAYRVVAPALTPELGAALVASTELGVYAASIVLQVSVLYVLFLHCKN